MNLSVEDTTRFYGVWFPLLAYTCQQQQVLPGVSAGDDVPDLPKTDVARIRDMLLEHPELLGRFIAENPEHLTPDQLAIAAAWEHRIAGDFFVVRFLKAYSVFMGASDPAHLYGVLGLYDPLKDLFDGASLPLYVRAVLLPFEGKIVYDGLITTYSIYFGPGIRSSTSKQYNQLKEREGIIEQLVDAEGQPHILTSLARQKPRKPAPDWRPVIDEMAAKAEKMRQADTKLQGATLELLRASARLSQAAFSDPHPDLSSALRQVRNALAKVQRQAGP